MRRGVRLAQQGRLDEAERLLRQACADNPGAAACFNNLGRVVQDQGRIEAAITCYENAIALRPGYAIALNNLGVALAAVGREQQAIARYRDALAHQPKYPEALNNLGAALHAAGDNQAAEESFRAALSLHPDFASAWVNLGHLMVALERSNEAISCYLASLKLEPDNALVHLRLAGILQKAERRALAIRHYRRACALQHDLAEAHAGLGSVLQESGQIEQARQCFEHAIAIEPCQPAFYHSLVRNTSLSPDDPHLARMSALAAHLPSMPERDKIFLHFALGKALADIGQHQVAFDHLLAGNAHKRRLVDYDESRVLATLARIPKIFTAAFLRSLDGHGAASSLPIFILGMPRSGSTLIEQILSRHPAIVAGGELTAFRDALDGQEVPGRAGDWTADVISRIGERYLDRLNGLGARRAPGSQALRVTDKMPGNFRNVGLIHLALPQAKIIHTCRDPIDTCLSCFSLLFEQQHFTYDLGELGRRYRAYSELMRHWHSVLPSGVMLDVQYEDVVANPEAEARRIIRHCGLDWHPACLDFHNSPRPVRTASVVQVRQPIYQNAVGRWRLDANVVRPLLDGLGFEQAPATHVTPRPMSSAGTSSAAVSAGRIVPLR